MPGAPGMRMYSKDDLLNMQNFGDEDADEDDDDDNSDDRFPSSLVCAVLLFCAIFGRCLAY